MRNADLPRADVRADQPHLPSLELLRLAEMERDLRSHKQDLAKRVAVAGATPLVRDHRDHRLHRRIKR